MWISKLMKQLWLSPVVLAVMELQIIALEAGVSLQVKSLLVHLFYLKKYMLVNSRTFGKLAPHLTEYAEPWELYTLAYNNGFKVESAVDIHFVHAKLDPLPGSVTGTFLASSALTSPSRQRVIHNFAGALPREYEAYMLISSHCLAASREPPSQDLLTQHVELLFVRGFANSGVFRYRHLLRDSPRMYFLPATANFQIVSKALREFISPPRVASLPEYTLTTKKWFLTFVRGFMVSQIPAEDASNFGWAGEASLESINPIIPTASYILGRRDGRGTLPPHPITQI